MESMGEHERVIAKREHRKRRFVVIAAICITVSAFAGCVFLYSRNLYTVRPDNATCKTCHASVYEEWNESAHAKAAENTEFVFWSNNLSFSACLGCHMPVTIWTDSHPLSPRDEEKGGGVDCASCHWKDPGIVAARLNKSADKHHLLLVDESIRNDSYICGKCHKKPWEDMSKFKDIMQSMSCQYCHMEKVVIEKALKRYGLKKIRKLVAEQPAHHGMKIEDLAFFSGAYNAQMVSCDLTSSTLKAKIKLSNYLPHSIPAVEYGMNRVFAVMRVDLSGEKSIEKDYTFDRIDNLEALSEKRVEYTFDISSGSVEEITFFLLHQPEPESEKIVMYQNRFDVPVSSENHEQ